MIKFSIIIPAYKAEKVISRSLESVLNQNYPESKYELIIVDDCSPDRQNEVIDLYTTNYQKTGGN